MREPRQEEVRRGEAKSKILVIDDEPFNLQSLGVIIKLTLQQLGFNGVVLKTIVDFAQEGKQAVTMV